MGFRANAYATIWEVRPKTDTVTSARIATQRKNRDGTYEQDFSGFVSFVGTANAAKAAKLQAKDRIKLVNCEVTNSYDKEKNVTYTNFTVWSFEPAESTGGKANTNPVNTKYSRPAPEDDHPAGQSPW